MMLSTESRRHTVWVCTLFALVLSLLPGSSAAADARVGLFEFGGRDYAADDLSPKLRALMYRLDVEHFERRRQIADEMIYELHLEAEATRRGISRRALAEELVGVAAPDDDAVQAFYAANKERIGRPLAAVEEQVRERLRSVAIEQRKQTLLDEIKREGGFKSHLVTPEPPPADIAIDGFPSKGRKQAPVTIVEFADYQCPMCKRAAAVMHRIAETYPDSVRIVFRDFPINRSGISRRIAEAGVCANEQDRFWDYHDLAFDRQHELTHESPLEFAAQLGFDMRRFEACLASASTSARVARSAREAKRLGLTGTPSVYVNGRALESNHLEQDLRRIIDTELARVHLESRHP